MIIVLMWFGSKNNFINTLNHRLLDVLRPFFIREFGISMPFNDLCFCQPSFCVLFLNQRLEDRCENSPSVTLSPETRRCQGSILPPSQTVSRLPVRRRLGAVVSSSVEKSDFPQSPVRSPSSSSFYLFIFFQVTQIRGSFSHHAAVRWAPLAALHIISTQTVQTHNSDRDPDR